MTMRMSTKSRFAVNAMIDLGLRDAGGPVPLAAISSRQQISLSYLEQLFSRLRRAGIVESTRGPGGGYTLGRAAEAISLADIVVAVEDELGTAPAEAAAPVQDLWASLDNVMLRHMATITLRSLLDDQQAKGVAVDVKPAVRRGIAPKPAPVRTLAPNSVFAFGRSFAK
jgi:Rrf2 family transcriptional regulator, iron-sulfur cluster assembly transcription factor